MSFASWRSRMKRRSKLSTKCKDAKVAVFDLPPRTLAPVSNAIKTTKKKKNVMARSTRKQLKASKKATKDMGREVGKYFCWLKLKFWKPSRDRVTKELKLTIFSISASSVGISSAILMGTVTPPALTGLIIAVPLMTKQVVKLRSLKKEAGGYRRLFSLIKKRETVVMIVGGLTVGFSVLILCVGNDEFKTICNSLDAVVDSTHSIDLSRFFGSITKFHENLVSKGLLEYTVEFADSLSGAAKDVFGIDKTPVWEDKLPASQLLTIGLLAAVAQLPAEFVVKKIVGRVLKRSEKKKKFVWPLRKGWMKQLF